MTTDSTRQITAQEATIKTASIEVKVLTLNGKQMTLAVFKQLREEPVIAAETAEIRGTLWGTVNYHPDCKTLPADHLHVVWQQEHQLRRSCVIERPWGSEHEPEGHWNRHMALESAGECYLLARTLEGWKPAQEHRFEKGAGFHILRLWIDNYVIKVHFGSEQRTHMETLWWPHGRTDEHLTQIKQSLQREVQAYCKSHHLDEGLTGHGIWEKAVLPCYAALQAFEATYRRAYQQLEALDQLFIAV